MDPFFSFQGVVYSLPHATCFNGFSPIYISFIIFLENLAPALTPKFTSPSKDLGTALYADNAKNGDAPGKQLVSHPTPKSVRKILFAYNGKAEAVDAPEREKQFSSSLTNGSLGLNLSSKCTVFFQ